MMSRFTLVKWEQEADGIQLSVDLETFDQRMKLWCEFRNDLRTMNDVVRNRRSTGRFRGRVYDLRVAFMKWVEEHYATDF